MLGLIESHFPESAIRTRRLSPGDWLFQRGDTVEQVWFVTAGAVELVRHTAGGKPVVLQRASDGAMLAEASAFARTYHCDAIAAGPAMLAGIDRRDFLARISDESFAVGIMGSMAREIRAARLRAEILSLKTVAERLDAWLAFNEEGLPPKGGRMALARDIGVTPEALYREIARRGS